MATRRRVDPKGTRVMFWTSPQPTAAEVQASGDAGGCAAENGKCGSIVQLEILRAAAVIAT
eukprot:CAMPEP_0206334184 /NCGR_PEP_ID=MMETSP0106_2-20121207/25659_1 /ASSEMBLY_ACC=CAM_ASM_000206 /TAXON_ID=81532 /ORGANISM="Acanthoeca-like sp., Strain 10tr" /LENGTH=60 /DNA_ID=CAMNT_0053767077 /DNA_START=58 /DNA_END=236 /DNA_ORIENTATION=-